MIGVDYRELERKAIDIQRLTIDAIGTLGNGHIGGALSLSNVLACLYFQAMRIDPANPDWPQRDRLVLSKGHGGPALYAALAMRGFFPRETLKTLNQLGTNLPSHCDRLRTRGIDMSTGSLGQGFSAAVGMALGSRMKSLPCFVYTIIGDGESQEGQIWEAAMLAGNRRLDNLIAFTDYNKMQLDGYVEDVNGLYPLEDKWRAFGWDVQTVDGHDCKAICQAIEKAKKLHGHPSMIVLDTVKGKGCCFAENLVASHNMNVTPEMRDKALAQLAQEEAQQ